MMPIRTLITSTLLWMTSLTTLSAQDDNARPWTFWYWMNGAVTRQGITADLESMAEVGLGGCYLMPIYGIDRAPQLGGTIRQGTPEWWQMVDFALHEADRLGLKIGMHICDGFALAGGPWITPAQSMQVVVSTDTVINVTAPHGILWNNKKLPAQPEGFYRDIAAYAIPYRYQPNPITQKPRIESENPAFTIDDKGRIKCKEACRFTYTYDKPVKVNALRITTYNNSLQALRMRVSALMPDGSIRVLKQLVPPRHGWQNYDSPTTVALPDTKTKQLVFDWTPVGSEPGSEDLDNGKWGKTLKIQSMEVLSTPRIDDWEGKSGRVWRVSSITQSATSEYSYAPLDSIVRLNPSTRLPKGRWRVVRIGHTSTLHQNATGGDCKGLECDKFSRRATQYQLNHWFGEAFARCDAHVARRTLKYMHIDSWECSSQNWSDSIGQIGDAPMNFAQYFASRRGYDLMPYLPLMVGIPVNDCATSERVLRDVRTTIAELTDQEFFPTLVAEARNRGCQLSAESMAPTMVSDGMQHYRHADLPMGEFWLNSPTHDKPNDMLDAISGGHVWGKQIIQAEGFTQLRGIFNEVPADLKALLDRQYCLGINRLFLHVCTLNPDTTRRPGMTLDGIGLFFQRTQPWWPEAKSFIAYATRCQNLLQMGRPVVDIAVYTGHEMPRRAILPERIKPLPGYHYDSFNFGALTTPSYSQWRPAYRVLALPVGRPMDPDHQPVPPEARHAIDSLRRSGIAILKGTPTPELLQTLGILPDAIIPDSIHFTHRTLQGADIYFFSNQSHSPATFQAVIRDHRGREAFVYDAVTDTYRPLKVTTPDFRASYRQVELQLAAQGSCFVFFCRDPKDLVPMASASPLVARHPTKTVAMRYDVSSPYQMEFLQNGTKLQSDTLLNWSQHKDDKVRYYSGRVRYTYEFRYRPTTADKSLVRNSAGRICLRFNGLHDVATVTLNGKPCGTVWTAPYMIDVTSVIRTGSNEITIEVANSWHNAIVGHDTGHDPFPNIWTNAKYRNPDQTLLPAGLGPIEIVVM